MNSKATLTLIALLSAAMPASSQEKKPEPAPAAPASTEITHVKAAGAKKLIDDAAKAEKKDFVVLDVRTPEEFKEGHVKGAVNIDFIDKGFPDQLAKLDRSKTYLVHCQAGGRSTKALEVFKKLGFKTVIHMDGGMNGWQDEKLPVEK